MHASPPLGKRTWTAEDWFQIYREYEAGRPRTEIGIEEAAHDEAE